MLTVDKRGLTDLGYRLFLDRYALKDGTRESLAEGDVVLYRPDLMNAKKEIGQVKQFDNGSVHIYEDLDWADKVTRPVIVVPKEHVDKPLELDPREMWERAAKWVSLAEEPDKRAGCEAMFYELLEDWKFLPGGRILAGAGVDEHTLSSYNCFVLPSPVDSKPGIFKTLEQMAHIMSQGGGVGINVSTLRPRYAYTSSTNGRSSGAVSWGEIYSYTTGLIEQGGSRRGALMLILEDWHPDIMEFINVKRDGKRIINANISVGISDRFMNAVKRGLDWELHFPDTTTPQYDELWDGDMEFWIGRGLPVKQYKTLKARELWDAIIESAWASAEPGLWFKDRANRFSNSWYYNRLICTNPCITGDTLIAVADGRHAVSIKELAESGADVPVYCKDSVKGMTVKWGRNPRLTRMAAPVYRVTLDDGTTLKATGDHRLMLKSGRYKRVEELQPGDSLCNFSKRSDQRGHVIINGVAAGEEYQEHRIFAKFANDNNLLPYPANVVHHDDDNPANNVWDNLVIMEHGEHSSLTLSGPNNPMVKWWSETDEQTRQAYKANMSQATTGSKNGNYGRRNPDGGRVKYRNSAIRFAQYCLDSKLGLTLETWDELRQSYIAQGNSNHIPRVNRLNGLFNSFDELLLNARADNHKVVSIEFAGYEDVYNITVDELHNYVILTSERSGIVSANCGEQPLGAWNVCNLGSINLPKFIKYGEFDWRKFDEAVGAAVRFLDNVIDVTTYPYPEMEVRQKAERRVGLGVMGLAELLIRLKLRYGSPKALEFTDALFSYMATVAYEHSTRLAKEKGPFSQFEADKFLVSDFMKDMPASVTEAVKCQGIRNVTLLTMAPTGTIGTMAGTSTGIEPYYFWEYTRKTRMGDYTERASVYEEWQAQQSPDDDAPLPDWFVTAQDLTPEEHVRMQAVIQRWVDSAISKTCNVPHDYTIKQVSELYKLMYEAGCKGGTVYRDKSRDEQILNLDEPVKATPPQPDLNWRKRPQKLNGATYRTDTPVGTGYITINADHQGPFEVFVTIGKAGSSISAIAEGMGRLISLILRMPSTLSIIERLGCIASQLGGIGSGRQFGFGKSRVKSVPDAISRTLLEHAQIDTGELPLLPEEARELGVRADICPSCGEASFLKIEGCEKCFTCGHSEC